jgi:LPS-assembly protein
MSFRLRPLAFSLLAAVSVLAHAEPIQHDNSPTIISADTLEAQQDVRVDALGAVELSKGDQRIYADQLHYLQADEAVTAQGAVRVEQGNNVMQGERLNLNLDSNVGNLTPVTFELGENHARGGADTLRLTDKTHYDFQRVNYTTCPAGNDDWQLKMSALEIDRDRQVGAAHDARVEFKGVPILYAPWMDFALNDQRKSGFMGPIFGGTVQGGSDITLPFYWNIAPNYDATLSPRLMLKRGLLLNNEFRYLQANYAGEAHLDVLPSDRLTHKTRSRFALTHTQNLTGGFTGAIHFNRVSDDAYFRDLSDAVSGTSQTNLLRDASLAYNGGWWNTSLRAQRYQTLQDPAAPVIEPYRRLPQLNLNAQRPFGTATVSFSSEFVDFRHPTLVSGQRLVVNPSVSYPLRLGEAMYLTPKFSLHSTHYTLGANKLATQPNTSTRTLPMFSLDSGVTFERDWRIGGEDFVQTLEPRAFYVYVPYRDQTLLPNFDSAQADFNFAQMFTDNRFFGSDRVGDANQLTLAVTSRLLEPNSGAERLRLAVGQRLSFTTPQVNLVAPTATNNKSDILFAASGRVTPKWTLDSALQYNPNQIHSEKFNLAARYQPEAGKVLNLGYRFSRNSLRQVDVSTQWPLAEHWHGMARWNYSLQDRRLLEALGGLEYNQSCWTLRLVMQRFATATQQTSTGFFIQLELNGLVRVGADPLSTLRLSVPGYVKTNSKP